jgi:class 3 adenylate cyclase/pimeloyl-ACP methyl ester carboxylesterase
MQPHVRYVKSSDGTRIAVSTLGEGQPVVMVPGLMAISIDGFWEIPEIRQNLEWFAEKRKLVQYDPRGIGLSSRDVEDFSIPALAQDLEAVVDGLDLPAVDLLAFAFAGPTAISFAARHPARVRKLVLAGTVSRGREFRPPNELRAWTSLIEDNWEMYLQTQALAVFGWTETGRRWAERLASDMSKETCLKAFAEFRNADVSELLPQVRCPTLVFHGRESATPIEGKREMAAAIPNARLMTFSHSGGPVLTSDWASFMAPVFAFLDEDPQSGEEAHPAHPDLVEGPEGTALILFADIVDSTALTESLGDAAFRKKARDLDTSLRSIIRDNSGTPVEGKLVGDGVLAVFTSARQAIEAARAAAAAGEAIGLPLHLGIHAGDVIREDKNVYGGAVNIAARIAAASAPGELLVSDTVRSLARTSAGVTFTDRGEQPLKGIADPVRLFAVT